MFAQRCPFSFRPWVDCVHMVEASHTMISVMMVKHWSRKTVLPPSKVFCRANAVIQVLTPRIGKISFKNTTKIQRKDTEKREERKKIVAGEGKTRNFGPPHPLGPPPFGPPHPLGPPPFGLTTLLGSTLLAPTFSRFGLPP